MPSPKLNRRLIGFVGFGIALGLAFFWPLFSLAVHAARSNVHSYILLVPFVSIYLVYISWEKLPKTYDSSVGLALIPFMIGCAALVAALLWRVAVPSLSHNDFLTLMALSFVCLLAAGGFLFLGRKWMAAAAFPIAFLLFMIPLPDRVVDILETGSKLASAEAANLFFHLSGTPVLRDGVVFQLPNITIQVAQECSGIRSSLVLIITSLLASHLFLTTPWRKVVLVAFVIPLGILRNGFRILIIALLCIHMGPEMLHSVIHKRGGPFFFALSLIPLFLLMWWFRRSEVAREKKGRA